MGRRHVTALPRLLGYRCGFLSAVPGAGYSGSQYRIGLAGPGGRNRSGTRLPT